jgi:two-component system cell cycle sensor histidine kinase/response regulator CckA
VHQVFREILQPPSFDDPEKTRVAGVLYRLLFAVGVVICILICASALVPGFAPNPAPVIVVDLGFLIVVSATIVLVRRGHISIASLAFSITMWLGITVCTAFFGGLSTPTVAVYVPVTVLAGYFWGGRGVIGFSAATAVASAGIAWAELSDLLPAPLSETTPVSAWATLVVSVGLTAYLINLSTRETNRAMKEARRIALAHRASEDRYRNLLEQSPDALFVHSEGEILFANLAFHQMMAIEPSDSLVGRNVFEIIQLGANSGDLEQTREILLGSSPDQILSDDWIRSDGTTFPVEVTTRALQQEGHPAIQVLARDVNKRVTLEEELRQSQKMEAIGRLAGGIAHDFNNMLTAILGHNRFLLRALPKDSDEYNDAQQIEIASKRASELTQQLLAFSRRQVLQPVVMELNQTIREMEIMLRRLIGEDIEFAMALDPDLHSIRADPTQMNQILLNLCVNARDSIERGGCIQIHTRNRECRARKDQEAGWYVELTVSDTGNGMDEATQAKIFDPFFSTKGRFQGTGLGLATVYGIVTQSGGRIDVTSEPGCGSRFHILFPVCTDLPTQPRASEEPAYFGGNETILIAEDEGPVRRLLRRLLEMSGYRVLSAENGARALKIAEAYEGEIRLLISDVIMPEMGGPELAEKLKCSHPEARILFISGYTDDKLQHPENDTPFMPKPFTHETLEAKVRALLDSAH